MIPVNLRTEGLRELQDFTCLTSCYGISGRGAALPVVLQSICSVFTCHDPLHNSFLRTNVCKRFLRLRICRISNLQQERSGGMALYLVPIAVGAVGTLLVRVSHKNALTAIADAFPCACNNRKFSKDFLSCLMTPCGCKQLK